MDSRFRSEIMRLRGAVGKTLQNTVDRPSRMLGNKRLEVRGCSLECWQIGAISHVAQGDTNIPEEAPALDAFDRRTAEKRAELLVVEREIIPEGHS